MASERILITDDETSVLQFCRKILVEKGYGVETASTASHALKVCGEATFDVLLTDIIMPEMDGLQLIEKARIHQPDIAAIVMTGQGTMNMALEASKLGVMGFIAKPFTPDFLLSSVRSVLEKRQVIRESARWKLLMPLFEITKTLMSEVDLNRLLNLIVSYAVGETQAEEGSLLILDSAGQLRNCVVTEFVRSRTGILSSGVGERIARWTMEYRRPILLRRNMSSDSQPQSDKHFLGIFDDNDLLSILSVPLIKNGRIIGVLNLSKLTDPAPFTETDQDLIAVLCGQAAVAVENARLFRELHQRTEDIEEASFNVVRALAQALETKDWQAWDYRDRMVRYTLAVAQKLELLPSEIRQLKYAALLHDIGLIGVRDAVIKKKGKFGEKEFSEMKNHPHAGAQIVKRIKFLDDVVPVIYHHHERWDGKGYPDGLAGEKIPIGSRILAVIDAFDAMTSERPYRNAAPIQVAVEELQRCSGTQFDPTVVKVFLEILGNLQ